MRRRGRLPPDAVQLALVAWVAFPGMAPAQQDPAAAEEIVVTGSRVHRRDATTPGPVTILGREQLASSSVASLGEFLQQLPEHGGALNENVNVGGDGETQINLRNLGAERTLVLIDGKRMVNGGTGAGTAVDLNSIPTVSVERVEIFRGGGSPVYGSGAIGGVVNVITRKQTDGVEASARLKAASSPARIPVRASATRTTAPPTRTACPARPTPPTTSARVGPSTRSFPTS